MQGHAYISASIRKIGGIEYQSRNKKNKMIKFMLMLFKIVLLIYNGYIQIESKTLFSNAYLRI